MKIRTSKIILIAFFMQLKFNGFSNDSLKTKLYSIEQRVNILEMYKKEVLDERFRAKSDELSSSIKTEITQAKEELKDQLKTIKITGGVIGFLLALGIGALLYQYFWGLKKAADKLLKKRLDNHLSENSQYILEMISSQKTENLIKAKKKILLITGNEEEKTTSQNLLKGMGFKNIQTQVVNSYVKLPESDLCVFSNLNGAIQEELVLEFMEKSEEESSFIFYSGGRLNINNQSSYAERVNFANSKYTLYHQIINTLSFKEIFKAN